MVADCNAALTHRTVCPNNSRSDRLFMLLLGGTVCVIDRCKRNKMRRDNDVSTLMMLKNEQVARQTNPATKQTKHERVHTLISTLPAANKQALQHKQKQEQKLPTNHSKLTRISNSPSSLIPHKDHSFITTVTLPLWRKKHLFITSSPWKECC